MEREEPGGSFPRLAVPLLGPPPAGHPWDFDRTRHQAPGDDPSRPVGHPGDRSGDGRRRLVRARVLPRPGPGRAARLLPPGLVRDVERTGRQGRNRDRPTRPPRGFPSVGRPTTPGPGQGRRRNAGRLCPRHQCRAPSRPAEKAARVRDPRRRTRPVGARGRDRVHQAPIAPHHVQLGHGGGPVADPPRGWPGGGGGPRPGPGQQRPAHRPAKRQPELARGRATRRRPADLPSVRPGARRVEQLGPRRLADEERAAAVGQRPARGPDPAAAVVPGPRPRAGLGGVRGHHGRCPRVRRRAQRRVRLGLDGRAD
jgi:translation initiation factor IF-2